MATLPASRLDRRRLAAALTLGAIALGGGILHGLGTDGATSAAPPGATSAHAREVRLRFEQAVVMLHAKQFDHAATALHRVLELAPEMPEAHVNMGFAMLGSGRAAVARDFFAAAMDLNPGQANAYYGSAMALEELGDLPAAIGAMRSYLHLARAEDERHLSKARAALWEWETQLAATRSVRK